MSEAEVLYSDVKFTRTRGNAKAEATSSSADTSTYSEVKILKTQPPAETPGPGQPAVLNERSKVTVERVALLVLSALLVATIIALGVTFLDNFRTKKDLQTLREEHDAVKRNLTERLSETKHCSTVRPVCPKPPQVTPHQTCQKCGGGWEEYGGSCYRFSTGRSSWEESRSECRRQGGDLVKIDSIDEQRFLEESLREKMNIPEDKFWIGLTDSRVEGRWLWTDGSQLDESLTFWINGEPDDWKEEDENGEDCVRMGEKGRTTDLKCWFTKSCKKPHRHICEKQRETGRYSCTCVINPVNLQSY